MILAHAGRWTVQLLYLVPLLIVPAILARSSWPDRHRDPAGAADRASSRKDKTGDDQ
jgi:hypothetical protein